MEPNESIHEIYTRFMTFINELVSLGNKSLMKKVGKILNSFPRAREPKVKAIKDAKNLKTLDIDEFIGSLIAYKEKIKELVVDNSNIKKKSLALKVVNNNDERNEYKGKK
ncbi:hypothetical protein Peur_030836 [Populus x canadensis]